MSSVEAISLLSPNGMYKGIPTQYLLTHELTGRHVIFSVLNGYQPIEFEKGKGGIIVGSAEKLPVVINSLVSAVRAGELDSHLETKQIARVVAKLKTA
jgi:hypothetical protein